MTRILLVDDHAVVRQGLKQILEGAIAGAVFGEAAGGEAASSMVAAADWDAVILDISLPGRSGLEVLKELRRAKPRLPVLVLSMYPEEQFGTRVLRAGAAGYLAKKTSAADLVTAVRNVLAGRRYVSTSLAERLAGKIGLAPGRAPHELLSDREFQVFKLLASGKTVTASAEALALSVATVSTYRTRILEKMGLHENFDLVQYAIINRLFD
jgi:two-component system, NarL family, invasion response regulator UvrY